MSLTVHTTVPATRTDMSVVQTWLAQSQSPGTQRLYAGLVTDLLATVGKSLQDTSFEDLQTYLMGMDCATSTRGTRTNVIKSLFSFAHDLGYLSVNVAKLLKAPSAPDCLAERILDEHAVLDMIKREPSARNALILKVLYYTGIRISECQTLRWRDLRSTRDGNGALTVVGKGAKTRTVMIPAWLMQELTVFRGQSAEHAAFFVSREHNPMSVGSIHNVVKAASARIGVADASAHWLRHSNISHALDHGAPVHVISHGAGHASLETTTRYTHVRPGDGAARYLAR